MCLTSLHATNVPYRNEGDNGVADPQLWVYEGQGGRRYQTGVHMNNQNPRWPDRICVSTAPRRVTPS